MFATAFLAAAAIAGPSQVELTIYNANFGLVKEKRTLNLQQGRQQVRVEDVAAYIDPTSVAFKSLDAGKPIDILEQNYQYDLISTQTILMKSIGKRIRLRERFGSGQAEVTEGILLAAPGQIVNRSDHGDYPAITYTGLVLQTDDGRIILNPTGTVEVLDLPEGLISKPTLMWDLFAQNAGERQVELAYLTDGLSWAADYVLTLAADDKKADLNGWVTIQNRCGTTYKDATLKLIAGDVRRLQTPASMGFGGGGYGGAMAKQDLGFKQEALFEYHLYTLQRPATIRNNEIKQISLLTAQGVDVKKELILEGQRSVWREYGREYRPGEGYATDPKVKVNVVVSLRNSEKNKLGMPLPKGKVRVYKRDSSGQVQMLGEDSIDHTPREESVRLYIGDSFDVVGERKRTNVRWIRQDFLEETFEIKVRNRKKTTENLRIIEHAWEEWHITAESMKSMKTDSNTFEYDVTLKPDEEKIITYTIVTEW